MAIGYSVSDATMHPGIRITGRRVSDPPNTLRSELTVLVGTGSETQGIGRWGDYSSMAIDPADDCTFWYTNQYFKSDGYAWSTHLVAFRFPECNPTIPPPPPAPTASPDFSLSVNPTTQTITAGKSAVYTVTVNDLNGGKATYFGCVLPLPPKTACSLSVDNPLQPTRVMLTVSTTAPQSTTAWLWMGLPLVGIALAGARRKLLVTAVIVVTILLLLSCGGGGTSGFGSGGFGGGGGLGGGTTTPGTPPGAYTITVTAAGPAGYPVHTISVGLTVQ